MTISAPAPLAGDHDLASFTSGVASLDDWLRRRAHVNQASGASRTYVACEGRTVVGYYALASGAVPCVGATGRVRRNMPDPVPMVVLGRLAVDRAWQGRGLGRALLRDAAERTIQAAETIGIRGMLVHAISPEAKAFYLTLGFSESPVDPMTLMVSLNDLQAAQ